MHFIKIFIFLIAFVFSFPCWSQTTKWEPGTWEGHYTGTNGKLGNKVISRIEISSVKDSIIEGVIQSLLPGDTAVRIHYQFKGKTYKDFVMIKLTKVIYCKNPPVRYYWAKNCVDCDSTKYVLKISKKTLKLVGERECEPLCSIKAEYKKKNVDPSGNKQIVTSSETQINVERDTVTANGENPASTMDTSKSQDEKYFKREKRIDKSVVVHTDSVEIWVMDNGIIDNDRVTLIYNDIILVKNLHLTDKPYIIKIPVSATTRNSLILYAENLGTIPPNTAIVKILSGSKLLTMNLDYNLEVSSCIELIFSNIAVEK